MKIKINNLSYNYLRSEINVINNLSLDIPKGAITTIIGLNGGGKTTLIKAIVGLLKPTSGEILIDDLNISNLSITERSKKVAYVSQDIKNLEDVIIKDYLSFAFTNKLKFYEKPTKEQIDKVILYAEKFHISHLLDKSIDEISGGERQIVSICSAIIQDSDVVVLDEPTSALDLKNQHEVLKILKNIVAESGKTIILSTHNPNHALFLNSYVALLKDGKIINNGDAANIIKPEILEEVYGKSICYSNELDYMEVGYKDEK